MLQELQTKLPIELNDSTFTFEEKTYSKETDVLKLFFYPNPYNPSLPLYLLTGNSNDYIQRFLEDNYPQDWGRLLWSSWGYEVHQKNE